MGTPDFAVASLSALYEAGHEICGVYTQPDKPKNRGHKLAFSPVKEFALTHDIPVFQPLKMRDPTVLEEMRALKPELTVVAAYGKILPEEVLSLPEKGSINVHSSILPAYRGAAPINWAILNRETETGVSIMYMAKELDAGDVIDVRKTPIGPEEDAQSLTERLAALGAELLLEVVDRLEKEPVSGMPQDGSRSSYAPMLTKELSPIDWNRSAPEIHALIRGLIPWPCASTGIFGQENTKIYVSRVMPDHTSQAPGTILSADKSGIAVACGGGTVLKILELQVPGGKRMHVSAYLAGHQVMPGKG